MGCDCKANLIIYEKDAIMDTAKQQYRHDMAIYIGFIVFISYQGLLGSCLSGWLLMG